jgi:hypothetical protein
MTTPTDLTRRAVLGGVAAGAALVAAPDVAAAAPRRARIGVLSATGGSLPAGSLVRGLRLGLATGPHPVDATVLTRRVPGGYQGLSSALAALLRHRAQVIVADVTVPAAARLAAQCHDAGVGLVLANVGAHVAGHRLPGTVQSSLQHWQSALSLGHWVGAHRAERLFQIVAVPDAGYDNVFALRRGFTARGGSFAGLALTHHHPSGGDVGAAVAQAAKSHADVVAVHASGKRAAQIVAACRRAGLRADLVVDPLALERFAPGHGLQGYAGAWTASSWTLHGGGAANRDFVAAYRARTGAAPDAFAVLGHDTGRLIGTGLHRLGGRRPVRLADALAGAVVPGARGNQKVDRALRTVSTPLAVRRVVRREGALRQRTEVFRAPIRGLPLEMTQVGHNDVAAYVNEYLTT